MIRILTPLAIAACAAAGTVHGVVLEQSSGRPVARTVVRLDALPGGAGAAKNVNSRSTRSGQFVFPSIPPGLYLLTAVRNGYFPAGYRQRLPAGRPVPVEVTADSVLFAELRLRRKGAITGHVLDENGIGTAGVPVVAYRARLPLRAAASAVSDDRGLYRIHGLDPGKYWVRSAPHTLEDGSGWLPTFGPGGREVRDALVHAVQVDSEAAYADIRPEGGQLFPIEGLITCEARAPVNVVVSLSSETGTRITNTMCGPGAPGSYRFDGLAAGVYEIHASAADGSLSGFLELLIQRPFGKLDIPMRPSFPVQVDVRRAGGNAAADIPLKLAARRLDLAAASEKWIELLPDRTPLGGGYWEIRAAPQQGQYIESVVNMTAGGRRTRRPGSGPGLESELFEILVDPSLPPRVRIAVSDEAARLEGRVAAEGKPVAGVPVFLWPAAAAMRRSLGQSPQALTDAEGRFQFENLPPGRYRVLSSFDVHEAEEETFEAARAVAVELGASQRTTLDLPLWTAP